MMASYTIVEDKGVFWIADEVDYVRGPFLHLWEAERELDAWQRGDEEDDDE